MAAHGEVAHEDGGAQGEGEEYEQHGGPAPGAEERHDGTAPAFEEELGEHLDVVLGLGVGEVEVLLAVAVVGAQLEGALVGEDGLAHFVEAVVGIAEVVVELGRGESLVEDCLVALGGAHEVALGIGVVALLEELVGCLRHEGEGEGEEYRYDGCSFHCCKVLG